MTTGTVASWNEDRGFGFVKADDQPHRKGDFLHVSWMPDRKSPEIGDRLEYDRHQLDCGRTQLKNVRFHGAARAVSGTTISVW